MVPDQSRHKNPKDPILMKKVGHGDMHLSLQLQQEA
jgi:hypothetical protein